MLFLDTLEVKPTPEETFIWVISKTNSRWVKSELGTKALAEQVTALRCGLDLAAWQAKGQTMCANLLKLPPGQASPSANTSLPFDVARAHALYKALFGDVEDLIAGKQLLIVPSGPLTQLPFQVLVTKPPSGSDYKSVGWLARDHALTVLPAVSSLAALRRVSRPSTARLPMIGFGDPLLDGRQNDPQFGEYYKKQAALARADQSCPKQTFVERIAALFGRDPIEPLAARGGLVDVNLIQIPRTITRDWPGTLSGRRRSQSGPQRNAARSARHRARSEGAFRERRARQISHCPFRNTWRAGRCASRQQRAGSYPDAAQYCNGRRRWLSVGSRLPAEARCRLGDPISVQHGRWGGGGDALSGLARAFFYAQARACWSHTGRSIRKRPSS